MNKFDPPHVPSPLPSPRKWNYTRVVRLTNGFTVAYNTEDSIWDKRDEKIRNGGTWTQEDQTAFDNEVRDYLRVELRDPALEVSRITEMPHDISSAIYI